MTKDMTKPETKVKQFQVLAIDNTETIICIDVTINGIGTRSKEEVRSMTDSLKDELMGLLKHNTKHFYVPMHAIKVANKK